jgi:hypothetical protein
MTIYHNDGQKKDALNEALFQLETHPDFAHVPELIEELYGNRKSWDENYHVYEEMKTRIPLLEHAILRLLSEIERKFEQGKPVIPSTHEVQTAWKLIKEPRLA